MPHRRPHLVLFESNVAGLAMIAAAHRMGYRVSFLTVDPRFYLDRSPNAAELFRLASVRVIRPMASVAYLTECARDLLCEGPVDGVCSLSDHHTVHTAILAKALNLRGFPVQGVRVAQSKLRLRRHLARCEVPQPRFMGCESIYAFDDAIRAVGGYPVVAKGCRGTGGRNVRLLSVADDIAEYGHSLATFKGYGRGVPVCSEFLIEEVVRGEVLSVECCIDDGVPEVFGVTSRGFFDTPWFVERDACFSGSHSLLEELRSLNSRTMDAVGFAKPGAYGFVHTEYIVSRDRGPVVCDLNARLAGGVLPRVFYAASDVEPYMAIISQAVGEKPTLPIPVRAAAAGIVAVKEESMLSAVGTDGCHLVTGLACAERLELPHCKGPVISPGLRAVAYVVCVGSDCDEAIRRVQLAEALVRLNPTVPLRR